MRYIINADPRIGIEKPHELTCTAEVVYLNGELTEESGAAFRRDLEVAEHHALVAGQEILPLCIDTLGGDLYALMGIIDAIEACTITIATVIEAKAMSAGAILATCGHKDHRYMGPNATIMIHSASGGTQGSLEMVENDARELKRLYDVALELMAKNCNKKKSFFIKQIKEKGPEWYINAKEAKQLGLISHIGIPVLTTNITYSHKLMLSQSNTNLKS